MKSIEILCMIDNRSIVFAMFLLLFAVCRSDMEFAMHCTCAEHNAMCLILLTAVLASMTMAKLDYNLY